MQLLDSLSVPHREGEKRIELYHGDLAGLPAQPAVDLLVVSAFPDDYEPSPGTLIGALAQRGVSLARLAEQKAVDMRETHACWLSADLTAAYPQAGFRRILCFEPLSRGKQADLVGEIFRSLLPFAAAMPPIRRVAMPLVAAGDQQAPPAEMLTALLDAAVHWLTLGLPLAQLMIVEADLLKAAELKGAFAVLKQHLQPPAPPAPGYTYDLFISYSHQNTKEALIVTEELRRLRPQLRIFLDRQELKSGVAWQQTLYEALDDCRCVIALLSPPYLASKVCQEEFNIAVFRHREAAETVLLPIYLYESSLPTYMKLLQYLDCRSGDPGRLRQACAQIVASVAPEAR